MSQTSSRVAMVDITHKQDVVREAIAEGFIKLNKETIERIKNKLIEKGDPLLLCKISGILAAKETSRLIPLCHPLPITHVDVQTEILDDGIKVRSAVKTTAKTGVEMEALVSASIALLTIWDVVKKYEKDEKGQYPLTRIESIRVVEKKKYE